MDIAILGLPQSGKTTVFNAITRGAALSTNYTGHSKPTIAVTKVPDSRLTTLHNLYSPKKVVQAEVRYLDVPNPPDEIGKGISGQFLNRLQLVDALLIVSRAFEDPSVSHVMNTVDFIRDIDTILYELAFADMEILDKRIERIKEQMKGSKSNQRSRLTQEIEVILGIRDGLEDGRYLRDKDLEVNERAVIEGFGLLTAKPAVVSVNVDENQRASHLPSQEDLLALSKERKVIVSDICGKLEMDLVQMEPEDEQEFRIAMGLGESSLDQIIRLSYEALDLITFFTASEDEIRAWPVPKGTSAGRAAGKIHTDLERGFVRAETVELKDLERLGSLAEARKYGLLRQEGKGYLINDSDVITILHNV